MYPKGCFLDKVEHLRSTESVALLFETIETDGMLKGLFTDFLSGDAAKTCTWYCRPFVRDLRDLPTGTARHVVEVTATRVPDVNSVPDAKCVLYSSLLTMGKKKKSVQVGWAEGVPVGCLELWRHGIHPKILKDGDGRCWFYLHSISQSDDTPSRYHEIYHEISFASKFPSTPSLKPVVRPSSFVTTILMGLSMGIGHRGAPISAEVLRSLTELSDITHTMAASPDIQDIKILLELPATVRKNCASFFQEFAKAAQEAQKIAMVQTHAMKVIDKMVVERIRDMDEANRNALKKVVCLVPMDPYRSQLVNIGYNELEDKNVSDAMERAINDEDPAFRRLVASYLVRFVSTGHIVECRDAHHCRCKFHGDTISKMDDLLMFLFVDILRCFWPEHMYDPDRTPSKKISEDHLDDLFPSLPPLENPNVMQRDTLSLSMQGLNLDI